MNTTTADRMLEIDTTTRFRRMPALSEVAAGPLCISEHGQQKHCDRNRGHVLQVQHVGVIRCRECGATWRDEGF